MIPESCCKMYKISEVLRILDDYNINYSFSSEDELFFSTFCPLNNLKEDSITWVRNNDSLDVEAMNCMNNIILFAELGEAVENARFPVIYVDNVHRSFFRVIDYMFKEYNPDYREPGIASSAIVETNRIGDSVYIGHNTYVGPDVMIGNNVTILNNVSIQGNVSIGEYTVIESGQQ